MTDRNNILAVDDSTDSLLLLGKLLDHAGYETRLADSGELALDAVAVRRPDLILLDIQLPGLDGFQVCKRLKASAATKDIPIILISAHSSAEEWAQGLKLGASDFVGKPFREEELLCRIRTHLALCDSLQLATEADTLRQTNKRLEEEIANREALEIELRRSLAETESAHQALQSALEDVKRCGEQALRWQRVFELAQFGLAYANLHDNTFVDVNEAFAAQRGYAREELIGQPFIEIYAPSARSEMKKRLEIIDQKGHLVYESVHRRKDGTEFPVLMEVTVIRDENGKPLSRVAYALNITARKQMEQELALERQRSRLAMDAAKAGTWEWELETSRNIWSEELWKLYGLAPDCCEPSYAMWRSIVHPKDRDGVEKRLQEMVAQEQELNLEWRVADVHGPERWLMSRGRPLRNKDGRVTHYIGVVMDISDRKKVEAEILEGRAKLAAALDSMTDALFISDAQGRFVNFNDAFATFHKFKNKTECATSFAEYPEILEVCFADGTAAPVDQWAVPRALRGETVTNAEYTLRRKDTGETWTGSYSFAPIRNAEGVIVGSVVAGRDITELKCSQAALKESEERLRLALDAARMGTFDWDMRSNNISWSHWHAALWGFQDGDLVGSFDLFNQRVHPEDLGGVQAEMARCLETREIYYKEYRVIWPDGSLHWIAGKGQYEYDNAGLAVRMRGTVMEITDRKQAEEALQQRNEELIRFVYTVSHDLKSPLVTIRTFTGYLEKDVQAANAARIDSDLSYIKKAAEKMTNLLEEILELSRIGRKMNPPQDVSLQTYASEAVELVAGAIAERHVRVEISDVPVLLHGDRQRLLEVFQNLLDNAVKFMGEQPEPVVRIGAEKVGDKWVVFVRDNGMGIDPRHKAKLFGLFEKLHPGTPGTGIGLALVKRIVEVHGGKIWAESPGLGQGSAFYFTLGRIMPAQIGL